LIILGWRISKSASWLLTPYLAWVSFAAYLNYFFWQLNK
jgi:tryptophan-rich sensory protein